MTDFTAQPTPPNWGASGSWSEMTYGDGTFVAVAYGAAYAATSTDGITWVLRNMPSALNWQSVAYGFGQFVAVAYGSSSCATSPDGITWTLRSLPSVANWRSVCFGVNNIWVTVATGSNKVARSTDGINWTAYTLPLSAAWQSIAASGSNFVVTVGSNQIYSAYSNDGSNWTRGGDLNVGGLGTASWRVAYGNGRFVAITAGPSGNTVLAYSTNQGTTWTLTQVEAAGTNYSWSHISFTNGMFIAAGANTKCGVTTDGVNWSLINKPGSLAPTLAGNRAYMFAILAGGGFGGEASLIDETPPGSFDTFITRTTFDGGHSVSSAAFGNGTYVVVTRDNYNSSLALTSTDGLTWTPRVLPAVAEWTSVVYGGGKFVAVTGNSNTAVATSTDGITWASAAMPFATTWESVKYGGGVYLATTGYANATYTKLATSPDGVSWTLRTPPYGAFSVVAVGYGAGLFVCTANGTVWTSPNGITWTLRSMPATVTWTQVEFGNGLFIMTGNSTTYVTSPDGITWTARTLPQNLGQPALTYSSGSFLIVGNGYTTAYTTKDGIAWTAASIPDIYSQRIVGGTFKFLALTTNTDTYATLDIIVPPSPKAFWILLVDSTETI